jgi:hypothetical protein
MPEPPKTQKFLPGAPTQVVVIKSEEFKIETAHYNIIEVREEI